MIFVFGAVFLGAQHPTAMLRRMGLPVPEELERRLVAWQRYLGGWVDWLIIN